MSEPVTFVSLRVEAFRGFRDPREFQLAGSAIIAAGPNGAGKTSFFDAIQWLLLGSLKRLESLRAKPTDEYVVNQYRLPGPATVEAELTLNEQLVRLRRSGTTRSSLLEWQQGELVLRGDDAERELDKALTPSATISLETAMLTAGLLQQDVMRSVLEAKPNERFDVLNRLLGLDSLERFDDAVREWVKGANEALAAARADEAQLRQRRQNLEAQLVTLEAEAASRPTVEAARAAFTAALAAQDAVTTRAAGEPAAADIAADLRVAHSVLRRAVAELGAVRLERQALSPETDDLEKLEAALAAAQQRLQARHADVLAARRAAAAAAERSSELARLAAIAIPLLSEVCPVCEQEIRPQAIADSLQIRASDSGDVIALQQAAERATQLERETTEERDAIETRLLERRRQDASRAGLDRREQDAVADLSLGLESLKVTTIARPELTADNVAALRSLQGTLKELEQAAQYLVAATEVGAGGQESTRMRAEIASIDQAQAARSARTAELARRQVEAKNLQDASVNASVAVGRRRVETLQPLVNDIYNRLDPHPSFTELDIEHDIYRRRGTMTAVAKDPLTGSSENPILIFSSSQANIAALSYFLALGWTAGEAGMPFVLLDDPLQSMDDVNVLGFADLCRFIRQRRQLFLSTHERRFALLLGRKLAPRRADDTTIILNFRGWDRSGPQVEIEHAEPQIEEIDARLAAA